MVKGEWERLKWAAFKAQIDARDVPIQETKIMALKTPFGLKTYRLRAMDGDFKIETFVHADGDMPTELTDYETNYQPTANTSPIATIVRQLGQDNISINPRTLFIEAATTPVDKKLESSTGLLALRGGYLWVAKAEWDFKDTLAISIVDKDDVLGLGGTSEAPIIVSTFIPKGSGGKGEWGIVPDIWNELIDESISSPIPNGLYLRAEYIKDGGTNTPKAVLNLDSYEV